MKKEKEKPWDIGERTLAYALTEALKEGGFHEGGCFVTCKLHNNQFSISWVIVDPPT